MTCQDAINFLSKPNTIVKIRTKLAITHVNIKADKIDVIAALSIYEPTFDIQASIIDESVLFIG